METKNIFIALGFMFLGGLFIGLAIGKAMCGG